MRMTEYGQEAKIAGHCDTSCAFSPTLDPVPYTGISLGSLVVIKPSLGSEENMDRAKTGCRLHRATMEGNPGEETSAAPLSDRAARKARKARNCLAQNVLTSVVQAGSPPLPLEAKPQELANAVPCSPLRLISVAIRPRQGSKTAGRATREDPMVSNTSTVQEASTPIKKIKKGAKSGSGAKTKDPAPPGPVSDYSDTSVVVGPSYIKPAVSSKPVAEAKAIYLTAEALNQADNPRKCTPGRFYPPELESFYKRARRDQEWTRLVEQLKTSLMNAKSAAEKEMVANKIVALIDEAQAELGHNAALIAPRGLRWKRNSTFEIQTSTLQDKMVGKALHALVESKALRELGWETTTTSLSPRNSGGTGTGHRQPCRRT